MAQIDNIKDALKDVGQAMQQPGMEKAVSQALSAGRHYEIITVFSPGRKGSAVDMHGRDAGKRQRFVRRTGLK